MLKGSRDLYVQGLYSYGVNISVKNSFRILKVQMYSRTANRSNFTVGDSATFGAPSNSPLGDSMDVSRPTALASLNRAGHPV